ncbi:Conserved_hypothetical protein [Hexamita inflata]|uniref:Uncharacterized protein n=1 Tax=Hexamita inflata TaxID=28002 RepID=A0AA86R1F5_9EUKA|nr:Conserved hypothetical protein [Hexamita inflata]
MITIIISYQLRCFLSNTTVMLDVQTRDAVFKAWPRTDATRETELCGKLKGDMFKLSIQTGAYEYVLNTLQSYDPAKYIEIRLPCSEVVLGVPGTCATAFKAKSAIYTMDFQEAKQNVTEAASNLRKLDFDRKACYQSPRMDIGQQVEIAPGILSDQFRFVATATNCKYPLDSAATIALGNPANKKAILSFFGYPNFTLVAPQYSVSSAAFMAAPAFSCIGMSTLERKAWCSDMVMVLSTQSFTYFQTNYSFPGMIPNRDGTLTRDGNYTTISESNIIHSINYNQFDCFQQQIVRIYSKNFQLVANLNKSMIICKQPIKNLINFDYIITRIIFQEYSDFRTGIVYQIDFKTPTQVLNVTNEWLPCVQSLNEAECYDILSKRTKLTNYHVFAQKIFYKNEQIVILLPLTVSHDISCFSNVTCYLYDSQMCVMFNQTCEETIPSGNYQFTFSFGDTDKYGNNLLNLTTEAMFPKAVHRYCANYNFSREQLSYYKNEDQSKQVSGSIHIDSLMLPIAVIYDASTPSNIDSVKYILIGTGLIVFFVVGIYFLSYKQ